MEIESYLYPQVNFNFSLPSNLIHCHSFPVHIDDLYCFNYLSSTETLPKSTGWDTFDMQEEFKRMNVPNDQWSSTLLNKDYEVCDCVLILQEALLFRN